MFLLRRQNMHPTRLLLALIITFATANVARAQELEDAGTIIFETIQGHRSWDYDDRLVRKDKELVTYHYNSLLDPQWPLYH
jgi:hypothetical protein